MQEVPALVVVVLATCIPPIGSEINFSSCEIWDLMMSKHHWLRYKPIMET